MNNRQASWSVVLAGFLCFFVSMVGHPAELESIEVDREVDRYTLRSVTWFDADQENLFALLADYDQYHSFTSAIIESRSLAPDANGRPEFFNRMEGCVLFWCRYFVRIGYLELDPIDEVRALVDAERSDFRFSYERWQLSAEGGRTRLVYEFEMIPDFWVPPVLGPYYIKRALRRGGVRAAQRIEALARGEEPPVL